MGAVAIEGVTKSYGTVDVIRDLSIDVQDGEFTVTIGPSGCGKSNLLRMVAGLESFQNGAIRIGGRVVNKVPARDRDIAMVFQDYALYPHMSVGDNMRFGLKMRNLPKAEIERRVTKAAETLQISHLMQRKPRELSGGQRQRVAMGRSIVREPAIFLFDEPLSNLDAKLRGDMRAEIKRLHRQLGTTSIYVTHDQVEAMTMADRIVVLRGGAVEQAGPPHELYTEPRTRFVAGFIGAPAMNFLPARIEGGSAILRTGQRTEVRLAAPPSTCDGEIGIRPEHVSLAPAGAPSIDAMVDVVEPLGSETLVTATLAGGKITVRLPGDIVPALGQPIRLAFEPGRVMAFGADGARL